MILIGHPVIVYSILRWFWGRMSTCRSQHEKTVQLMCRSQNVGSYEEAGEVNYTELQTLADVAILDGHFARVAKNACTTACYEHMKPETPPVHCIIMTVGASR